MARSIFAKQDSQYLDSLCLTSVVLDTEPGVLFLQIWGTHGLPEGWLFMLSFEVSDDEGHTVACKSEYLGNNDGAECFTLRPVDPGIELPGIFKVPGDKFCLSIQYVDVVTIEGALKRLTNDAKSVRAFPCADIHYLHPSGSSPGHK
ncbi:MAG: hypothetical protein PHC70_04960 [Patescibacteria group bacterium]|nr:hypothetical protein [Patescibacteria group bacterium]